MREYRKILTLDDDEHTILIRALNEMRNSLKREDRATDAIDELIVKIAYAKEKKMFVSERESIDVR